MARSLDAIIADMDAELATRIPSLTSTSLTAIWRLIRYVVALALYTHEQLWDIHVEELSAIAASGIAGIPQWYADMVLKFQYGHPIFFNSTTYKYYYLDTTSPTAIASRVVKHVAAVENSEGGLLIKVAGETSGSLSQLDPAYYTALVTYVSRIQFAGVNIAVINLPPDLIRFKAKVYYDGVLDLPSFKSNFETAFEKYLTDIYFNGSYNTNKHIDALQSLSGFKDILFETIEVSTTPGTWINVIRTHMPESGYYNMVPVGLTPTDTLFEYIAS